MSYGYQPYINPMATPQQRLAQMEQQYPQFAPQPQPIQQPTVQAGQIANASLVMNKEEALAQQVPDFAMGVFVNKAANEIYVKKLGNNGLPEFKTFIEKIEVPPEKKSDVIDELKNEIALLKKEIKELKNVQQSDADISTNRTTKKQS